MPAKSKAQQRLFGMVHAYQKGELKNPSKEVKNIADEISYKDADKFASTKLKGLPNKVKHKKNKKSLHEVRLAVALRKSLNESLMDYANASESKYTIAAMIVSDMNPISHQFRASSIDDAIEQAKEYFVRFSPKGDISDVDIFYVKSDAYNGL